MSNFEPMFEPKIIVSGNPEIEDMAKGYMEVWDVLQQAEDIEELVMGWYGVNRLLDLPPEGVERLNAEMAAAGWEKLGGTDEQKTNG